MVEQFKDKVRLNCVTHSVRAAQAVLQYGVGAMVDFPDQTLTTSAPEYWSRTTKIYDDRFAKALGVEWFAMPTDIAYTRFPEWYFCPRCRKIQPVKQWINEYKQKTKQKTLESDKYMIKHMQCLNHHQGSVCHQDLVVARIVTVCEHGHINDFPWIKWAHRKSKRPICAKPLLTFKTGASGTEGLEGLSISCSCGAFTNLKGAFDKDVFEKLDNEGETDDFRCEGGHPHKHVKEKCSCYPRTVQRGSSSVYFPVVYSSLVIPPYADKLNIKIENSEAFAKCIVIIEDEEAEDRMGKIKKSLQKWVEKIALEVGGVRSEIENILRRKWLEGTDTQNQDVTSTKYRAEEYAALSGEVTSPPSSTLGDFSRESMNCNEYKLPHIKSISLIDKVRVVNALIGYSRINPVVSKDDEGFVHIKDTETRWYPAYEVRGEGIFIELDQSDIKDWVRNNPLVSERTEHINNSYTSSFIGQNHPRNITPQFIMLHTLSHLLIRQLSFECGYSIASLSERIYCAEEAEGKQMAGIFIYTAGGDSEGTLGGLVRQGRPDAFPHILRKAIRNAQACSNDPVCILSRGQGRESLNLATCHACGLLPETCCEERNGLLDRGLIVGTFKNKELGFFTDMLLG